MKYKIKLQPGDYCVRESMTDSEYGQVMQRFISDSGMEYEEIGSWPDADYFGWHLGNKLISLGSASTWGSGRLLTYDEIMEQEQMSNEWFDNGSFPPLAEKCEALIYSESTQSRWVEGMCEGNAYAANMGCGAIFCDGSRLHFIGSTSHFRPIRTERERAIEAAIKIAMKTPIDSHQYFAEKLAHSLYNAGLLRAPEDK